MTTRSTAADAALSTIWLALGGSAELPAQVRWVGPGDILPSRLPVATLARATVASCALAGVELWAHRENTGDRATAVGIDAGAIATAFTSERLLRLNGQAFGSFAPLSRFWRAADGWVRTHGNYPHHRTRLLAALGVAEGSDDDVVEVVAGRLATLPAAAIEESVTAAGGLAVAVRTPVQWAAHPQGAAVAARPLLTLRRATLASPRRLPSAPAGPVLPATGVRVLDLTRVIAGPVATRILALLGADVLRVDSPRLPEIEAQHLDTGFGKRSTLLDLEQDRDRTVFEKLLSGADVVVTGYRAGALDRFGLSPQSLLERRPDLVVARLSAWGVAGPWAARRGFDSLVQAACGIAMLERDAEGTPGALPAQALDHGTGYLLAAAVLRALSSRAIEGGGWHAELSLAQTARWLVDGGLAKDHPTRDGPYDPARWCAEVDGEVGRFRHALPAMTLPRGPDTWSHPPRRWGADEPVWR